jgi:hypothetical protein
LLIVGGHARLSEILALTPKTAPQKTEKTASPKTEITTLIKLLIQQKGSSGFSVDLD